MWRFVKHRINNLSEKFQVCAIFSVEANRKFFFILQDVRQDYVHVLYGREKKPPRWSMCVQFVNTHMGMALGSMFVRRYFDETSKNNVNIRRGKKLLTSSDSVADLGGANGAKEKK